MATNETVIVNDPTTPPPDGIPQNDEARARALAHKYRREFVDLRSYRIQHELFRQVPVELILRYNFVPLEEVNNQLTIAIADPSRFEHIDAIGDLLQKRIVVKVATGAQIADLLKKAEQSQRVLAEASEGCAYDVIGVDEGEEETISIERLTQQEDISPIIKLVDTTI